MFSKEKTLCRSNLDTKPSSLYPDQTHQPSVVYYIWQYVEIPQIFDGYGSVNVNSRRAGGNPGESDSFLTSHPGGYENGVQTQGQF